MAPKLRDLSLTVTERTAVAAVIEHERELMDRLNQVNQDKALIAADIETRLRLDPGSLTSLGTYVVNMEEWRVEEAPESPELVEPPPKRTRTRKKPTAARNGDAPD